MNERMHCMHCRGSCGLMDRALDLKPEVTKGCGFESRLWQELSMTEVRPLSKAPNPQLLGHRNVGCPNAPGVCVHLDGLNAENAFHCSLYSVYVTNKAHLSLIFILAYCKTSVSL